MTVYVNFDGRCRPHGEEEIASYGFVIKENDKELRKELGLHPDESANANMAEYYAVIRALEWLLENGHRGKDVVIRGDSQLVIMQMKGKFRVSASKLKPLYNEAQGIVSRFNSIKFEKVDHEENKEADMLSEAAADA